MTSSGGDCELRLLGAAHVERGTARWPLPDSAVGFLLAFVGAHDGWVMRDEAAAVFWPDAAAAGAQRNLRVTLNRLRDRLAEWGAAEMLVAERRRLRWRGRCDVVEARAARSRGDWLAVADVLAGHGFAGGLSFRGFPALAEWAEGERRNLLALAREAVLRRAAAASPAVAAPLLARQLDADPCDEALIAARLDVLAALGLHEQAASEFTAFDTRLRSELGVPASRALAGRVAQLGPQPAGHAGMPAAVPAGAAAPSMLGREAEAAQARHALARGTRCVTITGMGGVGKTQLARALVADAPASLWLPLVDLDDAAELPHRLLRALGEPIAALADPAERGAERLARRGALWLVLDNAEHLVARGAALKKLLERWLAAAPALQLVVTSRQSLALEGELVLPLRPLALPCGDADTLAAPAVRLLVACARQVQPAFDARVHAAALGALARALGGLPLALRIAAHWLRLLTPADVIAALQRPGVAALDDPPPVPGAAAAEASLAATLARSFNLLDAPLQRALAALSVFVAPFTADDAELAQAATLAQLARLADQALLDVENAAPAENGAAAPARWQLHPLVRAFAAERLHEHAAAARTAHERHAHAQQRRMAAWTRWREVDQKAALLDIAARLPEVLAAWHWSLAYGRPDFVAEVAPVLLNLYERVGRFDEGLELFAAAEAQLDADTPCDVPALAALGRARALLLFRVSRYDEAEGTATAALALAERLAHRVAIMANLNTRSLARWMKGRLAEALADATAAHALACADGDRAGAAVFAGNIALLHKKQGHYAAAEAAWREALAVHREVGNRVSTCVTLGNLANLLRTLRRYDESAALLDEMLRLADANGFAAQRPFALVNLARTHLAAGREALAAPLAERALEEATCAGERVLKAGTLLVLAEVALRAGDFAAAAARLAPALRLARALDDPANLLEALAGHARWCLAQGDAAAATTSLATVLHHDALHAELRDEIAAARLAVPAFDALVRVAQAQAAAPDLLVWVEQVVASLQARAGTAATP